MNIALFGGSFDPPHIGHQLICLHLLDYEKFGRVMLVPCFTHPFNKKLINFERRVEMCQLLVNLFPTYSTINFAEYYLHETTKPTYTIDTIKWLKKHYPSGNKFTLIVGTDVRDEMDQWKDIEEINKLVEIMIYPRINHPISGQEISSTMIRERIKQGKSIKGLVPLSILNYIEKNRLYK